MATRDRNGDDRDSERDPPRRRRRENEINTKVPCPECGERSIRNGPWPWYLGTVGAMLCKAVICNNCGHHFDLKKPQADLASRKRNLALVINGIGLLGIIAVIALLIVWIMHTMKPA